jgi:hypothetical protein
MSDQPVTFVNVLDVEPERQHELAGLLTRGAQEVIRDRPGFISITVLASRDGRRVINLAQRARSWRDPQRLAERSPGNWPARFSDGSGSDDRQPSES